MASRPGSGSRGPFSLRCQINCATPSAPPASPAAGWIQISSNGPSRNSRPLATQFRATPPAMHRFFIPPDFSKSVVAMRMMISSVTSCTERARSISFCVSRLSGFRGGPPNSSSSAGPVMVRPVR